MRTRLRSDDGFTLLELMVVVVVIAVLLAIVIPTLIGARRRGQDRAAQSSIKTAMTNAGVIFVDGDDYSDASQAALQAQEPALSFVGSSASTDAGEVSTDSGCVGVCSPASKHNRFVAAVKSASGACWFGQAVAAPDAPNAGVTWEQAGEGVDCDAANAPAFDTVVPPLGWARTPSDALP